MCPGSFDPVTNGHLDIIARASDLFDEVVVAVLVNTNKSGLFAIPDRIEMLEQVTAPLGNITVGSFNGLLVDFCIANEINTIVKGLRAVSDFDYELQMAQMNRRLADIDTMFMSTNPVYSFISSSLIKEVAKYGGDVSELVPPLVLERLEASVGVAKGR